MSDTLSGRLWSNDPESRGSEVGFLTRDQSRLPLAAIGTPENASSVETKHVRFIDLFCGLGGFRIAMEAASNQLGVTSECVFSSDFDRDSQQMYMSHFGEVPVGDITDVDEKSIPDHEVLFAGFPCQAFSIMGQSKGFEDTRGTLFFDVARILNARKPRAFVLENVRGLVSHDHGRTIQVIMSTLRELGYASEYRILNALDFGLPQKRERTIIVGFLEGYGNSFSWPKAAQVNGPSLDEVLEADEFVDDSYFASKKIRESRLKAVAGKTMPPGRSIWHENKSGNVSPLNHSCALRAGASYNYLLVDGIRRLTPREMMRLQGFPEDYKIVVGYQAMRKLAGNSVPVPMIRSVISNVLLGLDLRSSATSMFGSVQQSLLGEI